MRILHTADLHLREEEDVRWQALRELIARGNQLKVQALLISGDLFDHGVSAFALRAEIRKEMEKAHFPIYIIPGNHDQNAYREGIFLGENVQLILDLNQPQVLKDLCIWGFPYRDLKAPEILLQLRRAAERADPEKTHLLMLHGELLDITGAWEAYGEEGKQSYFPVRLAYFQDLPWQYVLAGHFHTRFDVHGIASDRYFVYPGSPVSISKKETGQRHVHLLEVGAAPRAEPLNTFHYQLLAFTLTPQHRTDFLEQIKSAIQQAPPRASLLVRVTGYFDHEQLSLNEVQLKQVLDSFLEGRGELTFEAVDIREFWEEDLAGAFETLLKEQEAEETRKALARELFVQAMIKLNAGK